MPKPLKHNSFAVITAEFKIDFDSAFTYLADPTNLPEWAIAFKKADLNSASLEFPDGMKVDIGLETIVSRETGVIDWRMTFPDGAIEMAWSRLTLLANGNCIYNFMFYAKPAATEKEQFDLFQQTKAMVEEEFENLKRIFQQLP